MSIRKHRQKAQGKKVKHRRMPSPEDCKTGTRIHSDSYNDEVMPVKCSGCGEWFGSDDLEDGYCDKCCENY